jgi:CotH protein/Fn3 domain-containing protein/lamin tail-like protein/chitobiase/beta-hexosaminidase-like protein
VTAKTKSTTNARRLTIELLEPRQLLAANPIITEFMASNDGTLTDGNGDTPDWIEIHNDGDQGVDLFGYGLTDDPSDCDKWQFPSLMLGAGEYLVVFASGNNTPDPAGNLHTNFSLASSGEYLRLSDPSENLLSEFGSGGTAYPAQTSDHSYGLAFNFISTNAVTPTSSVKYLIPNNDAVDSTWTNHAFNDSSWQSGTASLGYENDSPAEYAGLLPDSDLFLPSGTTSVYVRIPFMASSSDMTLSKLQMKYDDGYIAYINGIRVASANAPTLGEYDSLATGEHPDGLAVDYVDFDISSYSDVLSVGANTLAIHMLNRSSGSSDLLSVPNLVLTSGGLIDPVTVGQLAAPTPALPNSNLVASDVQFSRVGGTFVGSFALTMTPGEPADSIRYTTDGSIPNSGSSLYSGPITVSSTTQYRARTYGSAGQVGGITTETYTLTSVSTGSFTSDLPIVVLENFSQGVPDSEFQDAALTLYDIDSNTGRAALANPADLTSLIGQHRRGSSTYNNPKINLRIELRDNDGQDRSVSLLGMPAESDWVLYAPYNFDRAMMRNSVIYNLSRQAGNYAPRTRFVEVYSNTDDGTLDTDDYMGVYVLVESIKRDSNRVDIDKLNESQNSAPGITGGYIIKLDRTDGTPDASWRTDRGNPTLLDSLLVHVEPERVDMTIAQRDYIRGYVQDFEDALYGPNSTDPLLGYRAYFDVDASIDHHLFTVLSKNPDGLRLSTYLTKDRGGKLAFGPIWDFDRAMGPDDDGRAANPIGWSLPDVDVFGSDWWGKLFDDPNFTQRWVDRWQELRQTVLSDENIQMTVTGQAAELAEAQVRNFAKWTNVSPNGGPYAEPGTSGWEGEISHLAGWLVARANWIDEQMISAPMFGPVPGNVAVNTEVTLSADSASAEIYYTLDGTDPRADGGGLAPGALPYTSPVTVNETTHFNARSFGTPPISYSGNSSYPGNESPTDGLDGNVNTKYLNFGGENSGLIVTPNFGPSIVRSILLTTANDAELRDPTSWQLYGTNETIQSADNSTGTGENWTLISASTVSLPSARDTDGPVLSFSNSTPYTSYKLLFPTLKGAGIMQVADIRFYQTLSGTGTQILSASDDARAVHLSLESAADGLSPWSQLVSALYSVEIPAAASNLRITELHYHPANPTAAELLLAPGTSDTDFEFIELLNTSDSSISLNGVQVIEGVTFDFATSKIPSLAPGATVLIVENANAFEARYDSGLPVAGEYSGNLSNGGEQIVLTDSNSLTIHDFIYDDALPWPTSPDGDGPSLEVVDIYGNYATGTNWLARERSGGTPGVHEILPGDFDHDTDVDGADFLAWQRRFGTITNASNLVDWETNFGAPTAVNASSAFAALSVSPAADPDDSSTDNSGNLQIHALSLESATDQVFALQRIALVEDTLRFEQKPAAQRMSARDWHDVDGPQVVGFRLEPPSPRDARQLDREVRDAVFEDGFDEGFDEGFDLQFEFGMLPHSAIGN